MTDLSYARYVWLGLLVLAVVIALYVVNVFVRGTITPALRRRRNNKLWRGERDD